MDHHRVDQSANDSLPFLEASSDGKPADKLSSSSRRDCRGAVRITGAAMLI